jgi:hypothetical protein
MTLYVVPISSGATKRLKDDINDAESSSDVASRSNFAMRTSNPRFDKKSLWVMGPLATTPLSRGLPSLPSNMRRVKC